MSYAHMAEHVRSKGRGSDTMLIHMTPREVGGLQALAKASGGTLTTNPDTGLPEAGWLGDLLPTLVGAALTATGIGAPLAAGLTGLGTGVITGDLNKGLMAGLQAFGGASAAGALGAGAGAAGTAATNAATGAATNAATSAAPELASQLSQAAAGNIVPSAATNAAGALSQNALSSAMGGGAASLASPALTSALPGGLAATAPAAAPGILGRFASAARAGVPGGLPSRVAPYAAGYGLLSALGNAGAPSMKTPETDDGFNYEGPYTLERRDIRYPTDRSATDSSEWNYFTPSNPRVLNAAGERTGYADGGQVSQFPGANMPQPPGPLSQFNFGGSYYGPSNNMGTMSISDAMGGQQPAQTAATATQPQATNPAQPTMQNPAMGNPGQGFIPPTQPQPQSSPYPAPGSRNFGGIRGLPALAKGGQVPLKEGSFIVDARTVSELGNGSSGAGQELLARHGGRPIKGPGDGVSDSIKASIGGKQRARVARDEVEFDPRAVARLGGGDHKKGTQRLYELMDRAHKARKRAARGQDTNLRAAVK